MARRVPGVSPTLAKLADRLTDLDAVIDQGRREVRRTARNVAVANAHRQRLLGITAALLRQRHHEELTRLGAQMYDIAEIDIDAPCDGLLIALAQSARVADKPLGSILLVGNARHFGMPAFTADLLGLPIRKVADDPSQIEAGGAVVADARQLHDQPALRRAAAERASFLIALLEPRDPIGEEALRQVARQLREELAAEGLELVHVSGGGDQLAFARRGLLPAGRSDDFSAEPA